MLKISEGDEGLPGYLGTSDATAPGAAPATTPPRDDEWTTGLVVKEKARIAAALAPALSGDDEKAALAAILDGLGSPGSDLSSTGRLRTFLHAVTALRYDAEHGGLARPQRDQIAELAAGLLKAQGVGTSSSKLGFLHGDLELALAHGELKQGKLWSAAVGQQLALCLCRRQPSGGPGYQALGAARRCLRLGHGPLAAAGFATAESLGLPKEHLELARLSRIVALRLGGEVAAAATLVDTSLRDATLSDAAKVELRWERLWLDAAMSGDHTPLIAAAQRGRPHYEPTYLLEAHLLARALPSPALIRRLPKAGTIKRMAGPLLHRGSPHAFLVEAVLALDDAYDNALPIERKLEEVRKVLGGMTRFRTVDRELLAWASFARWAQRYHQGVLAAMALAEYQALSRKLSGGRHTDVLGTVSDLHANAWGRFQAGGERLSAFTSQEAADALVTSTIGRSVEVSKLTAAIAAMVAKRHVLGADGAKAQADSRKLVDHIVNRLGRLKGPLMKVAQGLSYLPNALPEEMREGLSALQHGAQPVDGAAIRGLVETELKRPVAELFAEWEDHPFAAGSMGQVHRAQLPDGTVVAVKVRYPGIEKVVEGDFRALRLLVPLAKPFLPKAGLRQVVDEIGRLMSLECDYENEARSQTEFRSLFADDPRIVIPRVHATHSSRAVLTTDLIEGKPLADFVRDAPQELKNAAGATIFDMAYRSIFRHCMLNADPHPGNYLFLPDGRVAFLDFGFVRRWDESRVALMAAVGRATMTRDKVAYRQAVIDVGVAPPGGGDFDFDYQWSVSMGISGVAFIEDRPFRFTRGHVDAELRALTADNPNLKRVRLPSELVAIDRLNWGTYSVLAALEAEWNWHRILCAHLGLPPGSRAETGAKAG